MHHRQLDTPRALPLAVAPVATTDHATSHHCKQVPLGVSGDGVQDPADRAVVHPDSGGDAVQRITVLMGGEDRRNNLDRLPGRLGGDHGVSRATLYRYLTQDGAA
jgi:hypothetical protein